MSTKDNIYKSKPKNAGSSKAFFNPTILIKNNYFNLQIFK